MIGLAWRMAWRELRAGDLVVLLAAVAIAVAALASVTLLGDRTGRALESRARELLAADLVINADHVPRAGLAAAAGRYRLETGLTATLPSMAFAGGMPQLVTLKGVSANWPLRGEVTLGDSASRHSGRLAPASGTAWADPRLLNRLGLKVGDTLSLGDRAFRLAAVLEREPDGALDLYNFVPRVIINQADLPSTGLLQEGSRVRWRLLLAGKPADVAAFAASVRPGLARGERIEDIREARPEIRSALERASRFLGLTALAAVCLAAAAVALAARHWLMRQTRAAAVLSTLGATYRLRLLVFGGQLALVAFGASLLGLLAGGLTQSLLAAQLTAWSGAALPPAGIGTWLLAPAIGVVLVAGFALPPLLALIRTPAMAALRAGLSTSTSGRLAGGMALAALAWLAWVAIGDAGLAAWGLGGFVVFMAVVWLVVRSLLALLVRLPARGVGFRYGLGLLGRRPWLASLQAGALAVGTMALLTVAVVRGDLLDAWQRQLPVDAPNRFAINIQPEQRAPFAASLRTLGLGTPEIAPMARARLLAIDGRPIRADQYPDERARNLAEREFNLSWRPGVPASNRITAGEYWTAATAGKPAFSVETGLANTLGIRLGSRLAFDVAGRRVEAPVTSLREVRWDSFQVNFFVLASPGLLDDTPASYVSSFYLPAAAVKPFERASTAFSNVTVVDVSAILAEVRALIDRLAQVIEFLFLFTLAAGGITLLAATVATQAERTRDAVLLRTLGATRRQLVAVLMAEFVWLGVLAGTLAAAGASTLSMVLGRQALDVDIGVNPWLFVHGVAMAGGAALLAGAWAVSRVLNRPPARKLREIAAES